MTKLFALTLFALDVVKAFSWPIKANGGHVENAEIDITKKLLLEPHKHANMNKAEIIKQLQEYFESDHLRDQFNLTMAPLLKGELEDLRNAETNWQSFVLSSLMKSPIVNEDNVLIYHWRGGSLERTDEVKNYFCDDAEWVQSERDWCRGKDGRCWEKQETEFDAVLKDKDGRWLAVFEYEDDYGSCCQELCSMLKVTRWLEKQETPPPIFFLFYWLPMKPEKSYRKSEENLDWYVTFVKKHMYKVRGTRFVFVLQSGPDVKPYSITKTKVVSDERDFADVHRILKQNFEPRGKGK